MASTPTVVLVHGAFADASGFAGVIRELQSKEVEVRAPANPLRSLSFDADAIARYANAIDGQIILVGHSYGGAVITQAAPAVKSVVGLVYLSAFALDVGESAASVQEPFSPSIVGKNVAPTPPGGPDLFIPIPLFHEAFCADLPTEVAATMAVSQRPVSAVAFTEKATVAGWKDLPSWYMVSEEDNAIPPDCERMMAARASATVESVSGGSHAAFIAQPGVAAGLILKAVGAA
jgi:pimeloyl-ACP methyl ester carboxylesterase